MTVLLWLLACPTPRGDSSTTDTAPSGPPDSSEPVVGGCGSLASLLRLNGGIPEALAGGAGDGVYLGGSFGFTLVFGSGGDAPTVTNDCNVADSGFLTRFEVDGTASWARAAQTCGIATAALDSNADRVAWATLRTRSSIEFDGGAAPSVRFEEHGPSDIAVATYTSEGDLLWAADVGGGGYKAPVDLALGPDGAAYAVGTYQGEPMVFGPGREDVLLPYDPRNDPLNLPEDGFLARWNADGTFAWAVGLVGADQQQPGGVSVLDDGTVVVTGTYFQEIELAPGTPQATRFEGNDYATGFVAAFSPGGELRWAQRWGGLANGGERVKGGGASFGNVAVLAGMVEQNPTFGSEWPGTPVPMELGAFMAGWKPDGEVAFVRDLDDTMGIFALDVDRDGRAALGTTVLNPLTFGVPPEALIVRPHLHGDPVVLTYAADGAEQCAWHVLSDREDFYEHVAAVAFDGTGGVWATGIFQGELVFAHGAPEETTLKNLFGEWSTWVARFELDAGGAR